MRQYTLTPLFVLFGLLAVVGIAIFIVSCWRNIKTEKDEMAGGPNPITNTDSKTVEVNANNNINNL